MPPILLINAVGLTPRLLPLAPRLSKVAAAGWAVPLRESLPAVTCTAQATILTGEPPSRHGVVANGWLYRETNEVRFWQQNNGLMQAEPLYATAKRVKPDFKCAKLFWWFNQGADVQLSITPKPWYAVDGNKAFDVSGTPDGFAEGLKQKLGSFPFQSFWGPMAGLPCTRWIAKAAAETLEQHAPDLALVYLPHLDYDPQRCGPAGTNMAKCVKELDDACAPLLDAAEKAGAQVWIVSEYGHCDVDTPVYLNRVLRTAGFLKVRSGPFGEQLDPYGSRSFAVVDHQLAHVYVKNREDVPQVCELLRGVPGVGDVLAGEERAKVQLDHPRSGEIILLSTSKAWFAYPFWLDDSHAPDYARSVAIHHKPGYDPAELFFDPKFKAPKLHAARRLVQKKLGFRMTMDVVPLDASIVRGSHGLIPADPQDGAILVGHGPKPGAQVAMTDVKGLLLRAMGLG
jgi:predicted AlkP superfamily pyrophosphatase or phosphodiesterase